MTQKKSVKGRKPIEAGELNGLLTAIRFDHRDKWGANHWLFQCDCGNETVTRPDWVRLGKVLSCGCYRAERAGERMEAIATTHGHSKNGKLSSEYTSWRNMLNRCRYPSSDNWAMYGGRGIKVCDRWETSFENFLADMGPKPTLKHTIGREDQNGNYEPGNCKWESIAQQNRNRRDNRMVVFGGRELTIAEACRETGTPSNRFYARLRLGWTIERALTQPNRDG